MKFSKFNFWLLSLLLPLVTFTSCGGDDDIVEEITPVITVGSTVTVTNTLQSDGITAGVETSIENLFGQPANALAATSAISDAVEFPQYLLGLYDIDISENAIAFELVAQADDPNYSNFFRVLEAGTTDRYYFTFDTPQKVSGFTSDNASVSLRIDADNILVVQIGEGFNFMPGETFTITLNDDNTTAITPQLTVPTNLSVADNSFFPEDVVVANNIVYVSGFGDGTIRSFDLTESNPTARLFAEGEAGYAQRWGLTSDGTILLSILNNADFTGNPPGASKLVQHDIATGEKTAEWELPATTIGHTVSIVDGKYYVSDFGNPRIMEVDPATNTVNAEWFTSNQWDPSIDGNLGGVIYNGKDGFYAYLGFQMWYLPISNGQPGTLQQVNVTGLSGEQINVDGISWVSHLNTLYYASNDAGDPANAGTVYKLQFSDATTATGSVIATGLDDTSGVWYISEKGKEYLFVLESQFGALFGFNDLDLPFNIEVIRL